MKKTPFKKPDFKKEMDKKAQKALKYFNNPVYKQIASRKPKTPSKRSYRQKKTSKQVKVWGVKLWSIERADIEFSKWLRNKIGKCEKCGTTEGLTCSHYIGRAEYATRYLELNCDCLCFSCHKFFEDRKQFEYRDWKIAKHGQEEHDKLRNMKYSYVSTSQSIYDLMKLLNKI